MKKVKLGLIGCGLCATTMHVPALQELPETFEVVNVSSRNHERAQQFAHLSRAKNYCTDYHTLLADPEVEAVVITYPFELNHGITKDALNAGKHVMIEKPMAPSLEQAAEMVEWEKSTKLVTMIAENFRYRMAMMEAARYIREGAIGEPRSMLYTCYGNFDRNAMWIVDSKWRLNSVGGVMLDRNVHYTAVMRMLCGEAKAAIGWWDQMRDDVGPMDTVALHVFFENGAMGSLYDFASITNYNKREIVVVGTKGTVVLSEQCTRINVYNESGLNVDAKYATDRADSVRREYEDFYRAITEGTAARSTFFDGYKDLQLALTPIQTNEKWEQLGLIQ